MRVCVCVSMCYKLVHPTRGHRYKLVHPSVRINVRQHFFAVRIIPVWNSLSLNVVEAESIYCFKACLSREGLRRLSREDLRRLSREGLRRLSREGLRRHSREGLRRLSREGLTNCVNI